MQLLLVLMLMMLLLLLLQTAAVGADAGSAAVIPGPSGGASADTAVPGASDGSCC